MKIFKKKIYLRLDNSVKKLCNAVKIFRNEDGASRSPP